MRLAAVVLLPGRLGHPTIIVRPFKIYGRNEHLEELAPCLITRAMDGKTMMVHRDGTAMRDWLYVDDAVATRALLLHHEPSAGTCEVFNCGTGRAVSVPEITQAVCWQAGSDCALIEHIVERQGQVEKDIADSARFNRSPAVTFDEGLESTVEWYRENEAWWRQLEWMKVVPVRTASGEVQHH